MSLPEAPAAPRLFLLPVNLGETVDTTMLVPATASLLLNNDLIFAENLRTARRFISALKLGRAIDSYTIIECNKDTRLEDLYAGAQQIKQAGSAILMSEAGCPAVADPGARLVQLCHELGVVPVPMPGPNSLLLALMGSGFNGQRFCFHGYPPVKQPERGKFLRELEAESARKDQTQILIETPYRNNQLLTDMLGVLRPETRICIAADLTAPTESITSLSVQKWKQKAQLPDYHKRPAVHLIYAKT